MKRYMVAYTKNTSVCASAWKPTADEARHLADSLRRNGYTVSVWTHDASGARKADI